MNTGSLTLDILLGGYKKGIYLFYGEDGSGKSVLCHKALALHDGPSLLVDLEQNGVSLLEMWQALDTVYYVDDGSVANLRKALPHLPPKCMVAIDPISSLITAEDRKHMGDHSYDHFMRTAEVAALKEIMQYCVAERDCTFILTSHIHTWEGRKLPSFPSLWHDVTRVYCSIAKKDVSKVSITKPLQPIDVQGYVHFYRDGRFIDIDCVSEMLEWGLLFGVIQNRGSHYYLKGKNLGNGKVEAMLSLQDLYWELYPLFTTQETS